LFSDQFAFKLPAIIDFVGGGGKTALILRLVAEYGASMPIIYTTTTRIHPPAPKDGLSIIAAEDSNLLKSLIHHAGRNCSNRVWKFVVTRSAIDQGLLKGVEPDFGRSVERGIFPIVLNEADGARSMSL